MSHFLKEFIFHPLQTNSVCPSSTYLAEAMTSTETLSPSKCVVELGPGTGAITKKIMSVIPEKCIFFALEINPVFVEIMKEKFPSAAVYSDSAVNIKEYLKKHKVECCDTVISSLPWTSFDELLQKQLLGAIHQSLSQDGKIIAYSYLNGFFLPSSRRFRKLLNQHFPNVKKKIVLKNIPPAVVYECRK